MRLPRLPRRLGIHVAAFLVVVLVVVLTPIGDGQLWLFPVMAVWAMVLFWHGFAVWTTGRQAWEMGFDRSQLSKEQQEELDWNAGGDVFIGGG